MRITLLGKRWQLRFCRMSEADHGECDHPDKRGKEIRIRSDLKDRPQLEALTHEILHACDWSKDEEWVEDAAHDLSVVLWRLGYRQQNVGT